MAAPVGSVVEDAQFEAAHRAVRATPGMQFDFPLLARPEPPDWLEPLLRVLKAIAPVLGYLMWAGLIAGAALILWFLAVEFLPERRGRRAQLHVADLRPEAETARALLQDADALAAEGRFAEAVHTLLHRSLDDMGRRRPGLIRPSLTSRDIAALDGVPDRPRGAFGQLAMLVERSAFGGRLVDAEGFAKARACYEDFAFAEAWR